MLHYRYLPAEGTLDSLKEDVWSREWNGSFRVCRICYPVTDNHCGYSIAHRPLSGTHILFIYSCLSLLPLLLKRVPCAAAALGTPQTGGDAQAGCSTGAPGCACPDGTPSPPPLQGPVLPGRHLHTSSPAGRPAPGQPRVPSQAPLHHRWRTLNTHRCGRSQKNILV